jgi:hypothetical protein
MALNAKGKELLRELQRSDWLPPYNVRVVVVETGGFTVCCWLGGCWS